MVPLPRRLGDGCWFQRTTKSNRVAGAAADSGGALYPVRTTSA